MLIQEALRLGAIDSLDRELIIGIVLKKDRSFVLAHPEVILSEEQVVKITQLIQERAEEKPLAYILGEKEFFGLSFFVNQFTLIPRPETELLVEEGLKILQEKQKMKGSKKMAVIDVGTGSGCIIVSVTKNILAKEKTTSLSFFAVDSTPEALVVAKQNARRHEVEKNITFVQSDLLTQIQNDLQVFDELIIFANLPYLSEKLYQNTKATVQKFEPKTALLSGQDGLDHYRKLLSELHTLSSATKLTFLLEISPEQVPLLEQILPSFGVKSHIILPDLTGRSRVVRGSF